MLSQRKTFYDMVGAYMISQQNIAQDPSTLPEFSTPMMQQYLQLKAAHQDCVLLFRLGDFYEMFLDDAKLGAEVLGIVLTSRSRGKDGRVPMAGIPYHALENYLPKLLAAGLKVAICDQMTAPNGRDLVQRQVTRIITQGTVLNGATLNQKQTNFLVSISYAGHALGVAAADISTGQVLVQAIELASFEELTEKIEAINTQLAPREWIISESLHAQPHFLAALQAGGATIIHPFLGWPASSRIAKTKMHQQWPEKNDWPSSLQDSHCLLATAALLGYLEYTQKMAIKHLWLPHTLDEMPFLHVDSASSRNLELWSNLHDGQISNSLLSVLDQTHSAMGGRLLKAWLNQPLLDAAQLEKRLDGVSWFIDQESEKSVTCQHLRQLGDIERILARLSVNLGNPKDLRDLAVSIDRLQHIHRDLRSRPQKLPAMIQQSLPALSNSQLSQWSVEILGTIVDEPPIDPRGGGLLRDGQVPELDALRQHIHQHKQWLASFEQTSRQSTGISSLKIKFNQVFGYYIEISNSNLHLVPDFFERKQTLVNAERFTTAELKTHEREILAAEEKCQTLELKIFQQLVEKTVSLARVFQAAAAAAAGLDCLSSFATVAVHHNYCRPTFNTKDFLAIEAGRHPVVEMATRDHQFVPNDLKMDNLTHQLLLLTGPNMAGKSVLMRQVALITIMAQMGSFVPAKSANIPITDQIFVRSGAADMITAGRSTFMVEMVETANILRQATAKSLVIMDEIGRGTSTYDGISIAWAVAEKLIASPAGPKTLFATHYQELTKMADQFPAKVHNWHLAIADHQGKPVFLYQLQPGAASHSFGIAVAELAGLPDSVVARAKLLLNAFSQSPLKNTSSRQETATAPNKNHPVLNRLKAADVNTLTPLAALNLLAKLQTALKTDSS